jgi:hypothetical protein
VKKPTEESTRERDLGVSVQMQTKKKRRKVEKKKKQSLFSNL